MNRLFSILFLSFLSYITYGQEFKCNVNINKPKLQNTDPKVFDNLKVTIENFMNSQKWTDDVFDNDERININISLTISGENGSNGFKSELSIQATRPVYGSNYETPILSHLDKQFTFSYEQFQPIQYTKNQYIDNLTSMLSFYAYFILGLDYDSFAPYGGDLYFQTAQEIYNTLPKAHQDDDGWAQKIGLKNRFWMLESTLNPKCRNFRQAMYDYHRQGLDLMSTNAEVGRKNIAKAMDLVDQTYQSYPQAMIIQMFANSKGNEIVEIFKESTPQQKAQIFATMNKIDAPNANKYRDLSL